MEKVEDGSERWIREKVTIDAAYDGRRFDVHVFLPRDIEPPYQAVVYFPGSGSISAPSVDNVPTAFFDFLPMSGRAVFFPVYDGTFERENGRTLTFPDETVSYRDWMVHLVNDARRTVDYLTTRPDIQPDKMAYYGFSWGGQMGPLVLGLESRFRAAVLLVGGLWSGKQLPDADPFNFARHVKVPVLMLNGGEDTIYTLEASQKPLFQGLGTEDKVHTLFDAGHFILETHRRPVIRESLDWLDTHLGPVNSN